MKQLGAGATFDSIIKPLRNSLRQLYDLKQRSEYAYYDGYAYTDCVAATSVSPEDALSSDGLRAAASNYDDEPIDVILGIAFKLGYCAGNEFATDRLNAVIESQKSIIESIVNACKENKPKE